MTRRQALERRAYWQGVMRQQESSGLSISHSAESIRWQQVRFSTGDVS